VLGTDTDKAANDFLTASGGDFTNHKGDQQALFTTIDTEFSRSLLYADTRQLGFYEHNIHPGLKHTPTAGAIKAALDGATNISGDVKQFIGRVITDPSSVAGELQDKAIKAQLNVVSYLVQRISSNPIEVVEKDLGTASRIAEAIKDNTVSTVAGVKDNYVLQLDANQQQLITSLYGQDVTLAVMASTAGVAGFELATALFGVKVAAKAGKGLDGPVTNASKSVTESAPFSKLAPATNKQLQKKFKHAGDFGVEGNFSKANAGKFNQAIQKHINAPGTKEIQGVYRGNPATFQTNPNTGLTVIQNPNGSFLSGWKLNPQQLQHVLKDGKL